MRAGGGAEKVNHRIYAGGRVPRLQTEPNDSANANHRARRFASLLKIAAAILLAAAASDLGYARDRGQFGNSTPEMKAWFEGLRSGKGPCCSDADGTAVADVDWESHDGHYRVRLDDEWIDVPEEAVITEPNRIGRTMVWPIRGYLGMTIRCFMPGSMT
jgi:hypothetical protein